MSKSVYLCGPISGLTYGDCTDWRAYANSKFEDGIRGLSPLRGKDYLKTEKIIDQSYEKIALSSSRGITTRDRFDVMSCDMLLVNFLGSSIVSIGSVIELGWADAYRKPVVLVIEPSELDAYGNILKTGNVHEHPMVRELVGFRVTTLDQGINIVNAILKGYV